MNKIIYNLSDKQQLILFMQDCISAISKCPNEVGFWSKDLELDILKDIISPTDIFDKFNSNRCPLNEKGYKEYLPQKAKNTFNYVYEYGRYGLRRLCKDGVVYTKFGWRF